MQPSHTERASVWSWKKKGQLRLDCCICADTLHIHIYIAAVAGEGCLCTNWSVHIQWSQYIQGTAALLQRCKLSWRLIYNGCDTSCFLSMELVFREAVGCSSLEMRLETSRRHFQTKCGEKTRFANLLNHMKEMLLFDMQVQLSHHQPWRHH